jgi:hypothetical protein
MGYTPAGWHTHGIGLAERSKAAPKRLSKANPNPPPRSVRCPSTSGFRCRPCRDAAASCASPRPVCTAVGVGSLSRHLGRGDVLVLPRALGELSASARASLPTRAAPGRSRGVRSTICAIESGIFAATSAHASDPPRQSHRHARACCESRRPVGPTRSVRRHALGDQPAERSVRAPVYRWGGDPHHERTIAFPGYLVDPRARKQSHGDLAARHAEMIPLRGRRERLVWVGTFPLSN